MFHIHAAQQLQRTLDRADDVVADNNDDWLAWGRVRGISVRWAAVHVLFPAASASLMFASACMAAEQDPLDVLAVLLG